MNSNEMSKDLSKDEKKKAENFEKDSLGHSLLKHLLYRRNDEFEVMNSEVEQTVNQCLEVNGQLLALEDSNRNLKLELQSLFNKYETVLEKSRKDFEIIINLKNSESELKQAAKKLGNVNDDLTKIQLLSEKKGLERTNLQDERARLLFNAQMTTNKLNKINMKHHRIQDKIEKENEAVKEDRKRQKNEAEQLKSNFEEDEKLFEEWIKINSERDRFLLNLQEDIEKGSLQNSDETDEPSSKKTSDLHTDDSNLEKDALEKSSPDKALKSSDAVDSTQENNSSQSDVPPELLKTKTTFEVAEKQNESMTEFYILLNKKLQELNVELMCTRQWRIDKEAERRDLREKVAQLKLLVAQKRRGRPAPPRAHIADLSLWIKVNRDVNVMLRSVVSRCLSIRQEGHQFYSEFVKEVKEAYIDTLHETEKPAETSEQDSTNHT